MCSKNFILKDIKAK